MKRKIIALVGAAVLCLSITAPAFAGCCGGVGFGGGRGMGYGGEMMNGSGYGRMFDSDGNFLDREDFEASLDALIEDGTLEEGVRDNYLDMYDWCADNGGYWGCWY